MRYQKFLTAVLLLLEEKNNPRRGKKQSPAITEVGSPSKNLPVVALVSATATHHVHSATCLQPLTKQVKLAKVKVVPYCCNQHISKGATLT